MEREIKDLEIDKSKIELLFSDGKVADAEIEGKGNTLQSVVQKMEEKEERWFELSAKMEALAPLPPNGENCRKLE